MASEVGSGDLTGTRKEIARGEIILFAGRDEIYSTELTTSPIFKLVKKRLDFYNYFPMSSDQLLSFVNSF